MTAPTNADLWEAEIEMAHKLLASDDAEGFRKRMHELGFDDDEIERHLELERAVGRKP